MNAVAQVDLRTGEIVQFEPQEALTNDAKADAIIELAKRTTNWPLLEAAVEKKLDDQEDFVNWWKENVRSAGRPSRENSPGTAGIKAEEAEQLTGITNQQVSKWAKRLGKREEYKAALYGVAYRQAMGALLNNFRAQVSGKQEWYTPAEFIEAAREL